MYALLKTYWNSYGGWPAIFTSPFTWLSLGITFFSYNFWSQEKWVDTPISILPNLLGFNLASYSIWLAFGNQRLNRILSKLKEGQSYSKYLEINTSFIHFILVQIICLILAILLKTIDLGSYFFSSNLACFNNLIIIFEYAAVLLNGILFTLFFYSLCCMFAAILGFVGIASGLDIIYRQEYKTNKIDEQKEKKKIHQESITLEKQTEKLEYELELLKIQKDKATLELDNLKNKLKKSTLRGLIIKKLFNKL
ncbi:TPA: hypothetical protein VAM31_004078 [Acinetobacter baumannii]|nr:hypothetical protein [Acinetobacter baumannii]HEO1818939.1 hypothetical protein [Acinetobacter baumannii]